MVQPQLWKDDIVTQKFLGCQGWELQSLPVTLPIRGRVDRCDRVMEGFGFGSYGRPPRLHDKFQGLRQHSSPPVQHQTRSLDNTETGGSLEQPWRRIKFLVCRSIITDRTLLGSAEGASKTQTLARSRKKKGNFLCVASLAALDLLAMEEWRRRAEGKGVFANVIFTSRARVETNHNHNRSSEVQNHCLLQTMYRTVARE